MYRGTGVLRRTSAALLAAATIASGCSSPPARTSSAARAARLAATSKSPVPVPDLDVDVQRVQGFATRGTARPRHLRGPVGGVRETMDRLYTAAFLDPAAWDEGTYPEVIGEFSGKARKQAAEDVDLLTLGRAGTEMLEVAPRRAGLGVDVLVDRRKRPVAAAATMRFAATGTSVEGVRSPIRHRARYLLRRYRDGWKVVAYRVTRRLAPQPIPGVPTRGTLFILAIGSDARPGQSVSRSRADSLHIIGVNLRNRRASIVGIPRDAYVSIPGAGAGKINAALFRGGPGLVVRTVERLTGIRMDGYLLTGFKGFRRMVTLIGGVGLRIPYRMSDAASGAYFRAGPRRLKGRPALAFSRNRHDAPGGDFGRSLNQGAVILAALRELRRDVSRNPLVLFRWVALASRHLETDLSVPEMLHLLMAALTIEPRRVRNRVVSGGAGFVGSQSVVHLGSGASAMFRDLRRDGHLGG